MGIDIQSAIHKWVTEFGGLFYVWWLRAPVFIITDPIIIRVKNIQNSITTLQKVTEVGFHTIVDKSINIFFRKFFLLQCKSKKTVFTKT
jgi:hypothetical protein